MGQPSPKDGIGRMMLQMQIGLLLSRSKLANFSCQIERSGKKNGIEGRFGRRSILAARIRFDSFNAVIINRGRSKETCLPTIG